MIHYIYKIHFLCGFPAGRYYIGKRSYHGNDLSKDKYSGSGSFCKAYFKKYGKKEGITYIKEILEINPDKKINRDREIKLIGTKYKDDSLCMNLIPGGSGGDDCKPIEVHRYSLEGKFIGKYESMSDAAENINMSVSTISKACRKRTLVIYNSLWRYHFDSIKNGDLDNLDFSYLPVDQYDYDGNFIASFDMAKSAAISIKGNTNWKTLARCIAESVNYPEKRPSAGGFVWKKRGEKPLPKDFEGLKSKEQLIISQYDLEGNLINTFPTLRAAAEAVGGKWQSIQRVCDGKRKTSYGYMWTRNISAKDYAGFSTKHKQRFYENKQAKKVSRYSLDGKFLDTFNSISEACDVLGIHQKYTETIRACCNGYYNTAQGFIWKYV